MSLTANGTTLLDPNDFSVTPFRIERSKRTADGSLVTDVIAIKHSYQIGYDELDGDEVVFWTTLYEGGSTFTFTYPRNGSTQSKTVWITDLTKKMTSITPETWEDVVISMEEV